MGASGHSANLNLNYVRSVIAQGCYLKRLEEGDLFGALLMAPLMIKFKIFSLFS